MKISEELKLRGFINQHTGDSLPDIIDSKKRTIYHGTDPSADSAHTGNFVNWMLLYHLAKAGHKIIFLVGGGTGMIGDPKPDVERNLSDPEIVKQNVAKIKQQAEKIIGGDKNIEFVNNADWLLEQSLITFLRDIGKHFTVGELIKLDAVSTRLKSEVGLSYTEFAYPLLQAFDYLTLNRSHNCDVQVGGSDQWGNMTAGVDLIRRKEQKTVHAITTSLVVDKTTGKKFGKSEGNAIWLDAEKTTPYRFYQFWLNTADENVVDYLKLFTTLSLTKIKELKVVATENPSERKAQKELAIAVTGFVHSEGVAKAVAEASDILFSDTPIQGGFNQSETELLLQNVPITEVHTNQAVVDVLVSSGLATSNREARDFIKNSSVKIGPDKVTDIESALKEDQFNKGLAVLGRGKKQRIILKLK